MMFRDDVVPAIITPYHTTFQDLPRAAQCTRAIIEQLPTCAITYDDYPVCSVDNSHRQLLPDIVKSLFDEFIIMS